MKEENINYRKKSIYGFIIEDLSETQKINLSDKLLIKKLLTLL